MPRTAVNARHINRLTLLCLGFAVCARVFAQAAPDPTGLWDEATVYRDAWGVPHVYADTPQALGFAFGYAQAEDHLEAMLFAYRVANGRAAAIEGEPWAESDAFSVAMGHARLAQAALDVLDPFTLALCAGFAQGVNAYLYAHPERAPAWAEGVAPADVLALWHAFLMSMAPFDLPGHYRRPRAVETGNAWALAPGRTSSGNTLFVLSPHEHYDGPFRWYEAHLALGDYDVAGVTLFGLPVLVQGHNGTAAWALTPNWPDIADVFKERIAGPQRDPRDPRLPTYEEEHAIALEYMANARPYHVRTPAGLKTRYVPALIHHRGPVFDLGGGDLHSWTIGGYRDFGGLYQLYEMGRARDAGAFQAALLMQQIPCFHVLYADRAGTLFYLYNAKAGRRDLLPEVYAQRERAGMGPLTWQEPVSAIYHSAAWGGTIAPDALPYVMNPESGYLQACGNPPWTATDNAGLDAAAWPDWFFQDADTYRAQRVRRLLRSGARSFRDMQTMIYDAAVPAAIELVPKLLQAADARPAFVRSAHPDLPAGLELLRAWDYVADVPSPGMTFYRAWWHELAREALPDFGTAGRLYAALRENSPAAQETMLAAADAAARGMRNEFDFIEAPWGDLHRIRRGEREEPIFGAGAGEPIFMTSDLDYRNGRWNAAYGFAYAMAVELSDPPRMVSVSMFGASENPESEHYDDQLGLVLERRFKPVHFRREDLLRRAVHGTGRRVELWPLGGEGAVLFNAAEPVRAELDSGLEAPAEPPVDRVPFTPYVTAIHEPADVPVVRHVRLCVPPELVAPDKVAGLALYAHEEGSGWRVIAGAPAQHGYACFEAAHEGAATYAVLGPVESLRQPEPEEEAEGEAAPAVSPEAPPADLPQVWDTTEQEPPRTFRIEVLDPDSLPRHTGPGEGEGARPPGAGRQPIFRIERLDTDSAAAPDARTGEAGVDAEEDAREEPENGNRTFRVELLDEGDE